MSEYLHHCLRCDQDKPESEFAVDTGHGTGLQRWCRPCKAEYQRERRRRLKAEGQ
ncbi:hypothetical protein ACWCQZ_43910 [Streptomyces sp. NPDC002285]